MNKKITVSAPGKLLLFGEHAVIYNHPCIVTAVDQRMTATIEALETSEFALEAKDVNVTNYKKPFSHLGKDNMPKGAAFVEIAARNVSEKYPLPSGFKITTVSEFSSQFGFGSSSTSTVCTIKALSELFNLTLSEKEIFDVAYKTVLDIQGKGSGFDVAAAIYGGTVYFVTGGKVIQPLQIASLPLVVGYTGVKADTVTLVNRVKEKANTYPEIIQSIYTNIENIVVRAKKAVEAQDWQTVGDLMNFNQGYLGALGVSSKKLENMICAAREAGAYGAKLSGAGGGDCMVALTTEENRKSIETAITNSGGEVLGVTTHAEGVRVEK